MVWQSLKAEITTRSIAVLDIVAWCIVLYDHRTELTPLEFTYRVHDRSSEDSFGVLGPIDALCRGLAERSPELVTKLGVGVRKSRPNIRGPFVYSQSHSMRSPASP